eukprot:6004151-Lingulodinium_polyedra.AAC.1
MPELDFLRNVDMEVPVPPEVADAECQLVYGDLTNAWLRLKADLLSMPDPQSILRHTLAPSGEHL